MYYKDASAVCLVYDSTCNSSFEALDYWVKELKERSKQNLLINVVASKIDDESREEVPTKTAADYTKKLGATYH